MRQMDQGNQSAILAVIRLLMATGIIGIFEATYHKTQLTYRLQRTFAHLAKLLLFTGISELIILAVAAIAIAIGIGITSTVWDDPRLWAILPIYAFLYVYDWWDALIAASVSTPELKAKYNLRVESEPLPKSEIQSQHEIKPDN